jgi:hypothetical protein
MAGVDWRDRFCRLAALTAVFGFASIICHLSWITANGLRLATVILKNH